MLANDSQYWLGLGWITQNGPVDCYCAELIVGLIVYQPASDVRTDTRDAVVGHQGVDASGRRGCVTETTTVEMDGTSRPRSAGSVMSRAEVRGSTQTWASAHCGKWDQLDEKLKSENMQKDQCSEWGWGQR